MNDKMFNMTDKRPKVEPGQETTLVISGVPSKTVYDIMMRNLATGEGIAEGDIRRKMDERTQDGYTFLKYSEIKSFIDAFGSEKEEYVGPSIPPMKDRPVYGSSIIGSDDVFESPLHEYRHSYNTPYEDETEIPLTSVKPRIPNDSDGVEQEEREYMDVQPNWRDRDEEPEKSLKR